MNKYYLPIFEQYFRYHNLTSEEGNYYFNILRHIKEVTDSEVKIGRENYSFVELSLTKSSNNNILFNGSLSNGIDNKCIEGTINQNGNKVYVTSKFYRLNNYVSENEKEYITMDCFNSKNDSIVRSTSYSNILEFFETIMSNIDEEEFLTYRDEFIKSRIIK